MVMSAWTQARVHRHKHTHTYARWNILKYKKAFESSFKLSRNRSFLCCGNHSRIYKNDRKLPDPLLSKHDPDNKFGKPPKGGCMPVLLRNVNVLDKILVSRFQQQSMGMFHLTQVGYVPGMQDWLHMHIFS